MLEALSDQEVNVENNNELYLSLMSQRLNEGEIVQANKAWKDCNASVWPS